MAVMPTPPTPCQHHPTSSETTGSAVAATIEPTAKTSIAGTYSSHRPKTFEREAISGWQTLLHRL